MPEVLRLTEAVVRDLTLDQGAAERRVYDEKQRALYVRLQRSNRAPEGYVKSFVVAYKSGGRHKRFTVGTTTAVTLKRAREKAKEVLGGEVKGDDPVVARQERRGEPTVAELCVWWHQTVGPKRSRYTVKNYRAWDKHIVEVFGSRKASDVGRDEVVALHDRLAESRGGVTANRVVRRLADLYSAAVVRGKLTTDHRPALSVEFCDENPRKETLTVEEIERLLACCDVAPRLGLRQRGRVSQARADAVKFAALRGLRRGTIVRLRWEMVDFGKGLILHTDTKKGVREFLLDDRCLELLRRRWECRTPGCPFVFEGDDGVGPLGEDGLSRACRRLMELADIEGKSMHDLRRSYLTRAAVDGRVPLAVAAHLVGMNPRTAERYLSPDADQLADALARVAKVMPARSEDRRGA